MSNSDTNNPDQDNRLYRAFEDRHRGSRELIKNRLRVYLPFVLPLQEVYQENKAFDFGCGRGEWLELMIELGFFARGVDLDEGMLQECVQRNLPAAHGDALAVLRSLETESQGVVSAFHVVEHLSYPDLQLLIKEALRVLKPGGLLILEMPNVENLRVGSSSFYLDPTHVRPIPVLLLSFLTEIIGFARTKVLRLQEDPGTTGLPRVSLLTVLAGASPDCAVIAQKDSEETVLAHFDEPFTKEYGVTLDSLAHKYDNTITNSFSHLADRIDQTQQHIATANDHLARALTQVAEANARAAQADANAHEANARAARFEAEANEARRNFQVIEGSNSWRFTRPLRTLGKVARWFVRGSKAWLTLTPASRPRRVLRTAIVYLKQKVHDNPRFKEKLMVVLAPFPGLTARLRTLGYKAAMPGSGTYDSQGKECLTSRSQQIYSKFQKAIAEQEREKRKGQ